MAKEKEGINIIIVNADGLLCSQEGQRIRHWLEEVSGGRGHFLSFMLQPLQKGRPVHSTDVSSLRAEMKACGECALPLPSPL